MLPSSVMHTFSKFVEFVVVNLFSHGYDAQENAFSIAIIATI